MAFRQRWSKSRKPQRRRPNRSRPNHETESFMRIMKSLLVVSFLAFAALAGAVDLQEGREYTLIDPPQPVAVKGKIEVIEFFSYACPHCYHLEPVISAWLKKLPADVTFHRVPLAGGPAWQPTAKLFYALDAMG